MLEISLPIILFLNESELIYLLNCIVNTPLNDFNFWYLIYIILFNVNLLLVHS